MNFDNERFYTVNRSNLLYLLDYKLIDFFDNLSLSAIMQRFFEGTESSGWLARNMYLKNILTGVEVEHNKSLLFKEYESSRLNSDDDSQQTEVEPYFAENSLSDNNSDNGLKEIPDYIIAAEERLRGYIARAGSDPYLKEGKGLGFWGMFFKKSMLNNRQKNIDLAKALLKSIQTDDLPTTSRIFSRENIKSLKSTTGSLLRSNELKTIIEDSRAIESKGNSFR